MVVSAPAPGGGRDKSPHRSKQDLSACRSRLLELMQSVNFGRIEHLSIAGGEPILDPCPVIVREHKFGGDNGPRPEVAAEDFLLKQKVVELFAFFDELQDGVIDVLEIKHGLPFRMIVTEVPA
ncbi:hypothetical protein Pan97_39830 [Bremerella volcania]|uniref:Uncharacterized protein n=1 Tax=Bremerella volcania TaxID=2527984 RepID=A0A518CCH3_9BACT|nr:hypothetical protein [Bremerella volcania]QDU76926.1 hypothetical protein Pan97_39830 [Bremerella volcania]